MHLQIESMYASGIPPHESDKRIVVDGQTYTVSRRVDEWLPDDPTDFSVDLFFTVVDSDSGETREFVVRVCSAQSLATGLGVADGIISGENRIIMARWDFPLLTRLLEAKLAATYADSWELATQKLAGFGASMDEWADDPGHHMVRHW